MHALTASELLGIWEEGLNRSSVQRALILLTAAYPETAPIALEELAIGERDTRLMALRERTFGPQLVGVATCPECGARLESAFSLADIRTAFPSEPSCGRREGDTKHETSAFCMGDYEVVFRLPNSRDLKIVAGDDALTESRQRVLERCLLMIRRNGEDCPLDELSGEILEAVENRMALIDPRGDVRLSLSCPDCRHEWVAAFDIMAFFWAEIDAWAFRLLRETHTLASAYGWREADILAMGPRRRELYLKLING